MFTDLQMSSASVWVNKENEDNEDYNDVDDNDDDDENDNTMQLN